MRFLAVVLTGWVAVRTVLLWPQLETAADVLRIVAPATFVAEPRAVPLSTAGPVTIVPHLTRTARAAKAAKTILAMPAPPLRAVDPGLVALAVLGLVRFGDPQIVGDAAPILPGVPRPHPSAAPGTAEGPASPGSRWSGSAWLLARGGSGVAAGGLGGQLGGSQAGVRLAYLVDRRHRIGLAGRVSSPLGSGQREAALGVEWQPTRLPVRLVAEQRIALGAGRGGPALAVVGGLAPLALPLDFRLEGYGQAGVIRRSGAEAYADGAVRLAKPIAEIGRSRLDLGAGLWGGAQRGAARLDVGPSVALAMPVGERWVRLGLDWRQRIAGAARPGSGVTLTLGSDF